MTEKKEFSPYVLDFIQAMNKAQSKGVISLLMFIRNTQMATATLLKDDTLSNEENKLIFQINEKRERQELLTENEKTDFAKLAEQVLKKHGLLRN